MSIRPDVFFWRPHIERRSFVFPHPDGPTRTMNSPSSIVSSTPSTALTPFVNSFVTLQFMFLKEFGVGLAIAVLVDATIVRAVLLPATMKLLGDWNWYLPRWLEWLPRLEHAAGDKATPVITQAIPQPAD